MLVELLVLFMISPKCVHVLYALLSWVRVSRIIVVIPCVCLTVMTYSALLDVLKKK